MGSMSFNEMSSGNGFPRGTRLNWHADDDGVLWDDCDDEREGRSDEEEGEGHREEEGDGVVAGETESEDDEENKSSERLELIAVEREMFRLWA